MTGKAKQLDDPIASLLAAKPVAVLDGGLATELERRGHDLRHQLWSAKLLAEDPQAIREVHLDYARAGADVLISATYQASLPGFENAGYTQARGADFIREAVALAQVSAEVGRQVLVAASVGPYGAYLADGSEFVGNYGLSASELCDWHQSRLEILQGSGADLLAIETIPSVVEVEALRDLLAEYDRIPAWISFSSVKEGELCDGTPLAEAVAVVAECPQIVAVGVNCLRPSFVKRSVEIIGQATDKPILAYPNSGETFDRASRSWTGVSDPGEYQTAAKVWQEAGCRLIGGCCRTTPAHIARLTDAFSTS